MSRKVDQFKESFGSPLTVNNFEIDIPNMSGSIDVFAQSATFPGTKLRITELNYWGEKVGFPAIPDYSRRWRVTIPENLNGKTYESIKKAMNLWYEQYTGLLLLPTSLGQTINVRMIHPYTGKEIFNAKLHNAFIIGYDDITLNAAGATETMMFNVEFYYDWVQNNA